MTTLELLGALAVDEAIGDPPKWPHPVRAIGIAITAFEDVAAGAGAMEGEAGRVSGALCAIAVPTAAYVVAWSALRIAEKFGLHARALTSVVLGASMLAARCLRDEVTAVAQALEARDLPLARQRLARIVGRDTAGLDEHEIARAAIESLAESTCDGVLAPLFYLVIGGVPLAAAYKAINTLDSMIGHVEPPYRDFGYCSAKLDDLANLLPARMTALAIAVAGQLLRESGTQSLRICTRDARAHRSPNAGWPEGAMAGALGVRLGGANRYDGELRAGATLGAEFRSPRTHDIRRALGIASVATLLAAAAAVLAAALRDARA